MPRLSNVDAQIAATNATINSINIRSATAASVPDGNWNITTAASPSEFSIPSLPPILNVTSVQNNINDDIYVDFTGGGTER